MNDLLAALAAAGIDDSPVFDGNIHRCKVAGKKGKPGWYVFHDLNGKIFGCFGDWSTGEKSEWKNGNGLASLTDREMEALRLAAEARRRERRRMAEQAAKEAAELLRDAEEIEGHPYCLAKGIKGAVPVADGEIIVPLYDSENKLTGAQKIDAAGGKLFVYGSQKKGCFCPLAGDELTVYVCEGWATGKTINEATRCKVLVAFDAGNLLPVAEQAVRLYAKAEVITAADNDHSKEVNTGLNEARKVKERLKIDFVFPECSGTDFNDLAAEQGIDAVRKALMPQETKIRILSDEAIQSDSLTLRIPEHVLNPGGLISKCMAEMRSSGLPDIPQYNFPVVLAAIARAISGKITAAGFWPNLYMLKVGPTSSGKSSSDKFMQAQLDRLNGFYGPSDFASGPALLRALSQQPCALIVLDEATKMFRRYRGGPDPILDGKKDVLLELHSKTGRAYRKAYADIKNTIYIQNPCVSVTGNATPVIFDSIKQEDFETGMMQRFDFFCYDGPILRRSRDNSSMTDSVSDAVNELYSSRTGAALQNVMNNPQEIGFSDQAWMLYDKWSEEITKEANLSDEGGARGIVSRQFEASIKYAMIHHASANGPEKFAHPVSDESLQWGIDAAKMLADWKLNVLPKKVTSGDFHRDCELFKDAIRAALKRKGRAGKPLRPTFALLSERKSALKNWDKRYSSSIVEVLSERGEIILDEAGRSTAYYLAKFD